MESDDLVLCSDLEEGLRAMVGYFVEVCRSESQCKKEQGDGVRWGEGVRV